MKITITDDEVGTRLDKLIVARAAGLGRAGAKRLFTLGRVRVLHPGEDRGHRAAKGDVAQAGDVIDVELEEAEGAAPDAEAPLTVVLETKAIVILDKPAGQPSAPIEPNELGTAANALLARYPEMKSVGFSPREPGLCHRLDTETSGLLLAARTDEAFRVMTKALKEERLDKRYLLICAAADLPESGTIDIPLAPHPKDHRRVYPCIHPRDVVRYQPRPATTSFKVVKKKGALALVEARASKAMRHQVRAHFAAMGHPLVGDELYGGDKVEGLSRHALHASYLAFDGDGPVDAFKVELPLPEDLAALV